LIDSIRYPKNQKPKRNR